MSYSSKYHERACLSEGKKPTLSTAYVNLSENANREPEIFYSMETDPSKLIRESETAVFELETFIN